MINKVKSDRDLKFWENADDDDDEIEIEVYEMDEEASEDAVDVYDDEADIDSENLSEIVTDELENVEAATESFDDAIRMFKDNDTEEEQ